MEERPLPSRLERIKERHRAMREEQERIEWEALLDESEKAEEEGRNPD